MRYIILFCSLFLFGVTVSAQSYEECVTLFKQNKREKALAGIDELIKKKAATADVYLLKALVEIENCHYYAGFKAFKQFYKQSEAPYAYMYALANSGIFSMAEVTTKGDYKSFFEDLVSDKSIPAETKAFAIEKLASSYEFNNEKDKSKALYLQLEDVKNWSTVGVFENISESGFNKDFGVVDHPESSYEFTNKRGAKVKWFVVPDVRNDRWWDFEYNYDISSSVIYAQTFVKAEEDKEVLLKVGVSGSMKVWVNDYLVGQENEERNTDLDVYSYKVKLQQGYNRILLQVGSSGLGRSNYMVRLSTPDGQIINNVVSEAAYKPYRKAAPYTVQKSPFYPEKFFEDKLQTGANDFVTGLMLLDVYNHNDKKYKSRKLAAELKKKYPSSTVVSMKLIEALNRDDNEVDVKKEVEYVKRNDSESYIGLQYRYNEKYANEEWNACLDILNRGIALYGENEDYENKLLDILAKMKDVEKLLAEIKAAYKKYPASATFLSVQYLLDKNTNKNVKLSNELLEQYLKNYYNENIYEEVFYNYLNTGQKDLGIKRLKQLIEYKPYAIMRYNKLASIYFDKREYNKALEYQQMAIDRAPYEGQFYYGKGVIYEAMGEKDQALNMYERAIYYTPSNYEARHKQRLLSGKKALGDYFKTEDADFIYNKALNDNAYPDENAVYLLSDEKQVIYPEGGASELSYEMLVQVLNQTAIDRLKETSIPYNSNNQKLIIQKAEVLKTDGSKVAAQVQDNYVVFTALEKKDAVHLVYRIEESSSGTLSDHFWHDYTFNSFYPVQHGRFSLIVPKDKKFVHKVYNADVQPQVTDIDEYKMYVWEKKDCPPIEEELSMPTYNDIAERLVVTSIPDWSFIAKWYSDVSTVKSKSDFEIKEKVKEVFANGMPSSDLEKAKAIYEYIERNFYYSNVSFLQSAFIPQTASHTANAKMGDCKDLSTLFVAMAREVGLNANLVLVDTRDNGYNNLLLPVVGFNHCIAQLNLQDKKYYEELTNSNLPFGTLDLSLLNANGLEIPYENDGKKDAHLVRINTKAKPANAIIRYGEMSLNGDMAVIKRKVLKTGSQSSFTRASYKDMDTDARIKDLTASLVSEFSKDVNISKMTVTHMDDLCDTVDLTYDFTVKKYANKIIDMQVFKLPWTDNYLVQDFVTLSQRTHPLELWYLAEVPAQSEEITVIFPPGKKLAEMPKDVTVSCPEMTYKITYKASPGKLVARREMVFHKDVIAPASYAGFKDFVTKSNEANAVQIVLK